MSDRVDNDAFFDGRALAPAPEMEGDRFFAGGEPVAPSPSVMLTLAQSPVKFGLILFVFGWMGILVQRGFFSQVVAGAPLFEEPAKVGAAIVLVGLLPLRHVLVRVPLAGLLGAGFGVFEHVSTYAEEDTFGYAWRVAFHALSTATSMAAFTALQPATDARLRWASTLPSTLLHYANNFVALALGIGSIALPALGVVATGWSVAATVLLGLVMVLVVARPEGFREGVAALARRFIPAMRPPT